MRKFFKTYYSPDKHDKIDLIFERGYKNIVVRYNGKEVKHFAGVSSLFEKQEISTPDDSLIHLRFLKDSVEFEVFFNGRQIDNSETSPKKVVANLQWPIYISLSWYILVLGFLFFYYDHISSYIFTYPESIYSDFRVIYIFTSTAITLLVLIAALISLRYGNMPMYYIATFVICADALYGVTHVFYTLSAGIVSFDIGVLFALILPLIFKSAAIFGFIRNIRKYKEYALQQAQDKQKVNPDIVDL